jgi:hypothetical protein
MPFCIFQISAKKVSWLDKSLHSLNESKVLLHDFCKLKLQKLSKNVQELFCQARKLFLQKFEKWHFWANVMSRQPRVWASRASPAQKARGLRVVLFQKLFKG